MASDHRTDVPTAGRSAAAAGALVSADAVLGAAGVGAETVGLLMAAARW
ncbi:MAG: hypothetical protein ACRD0V_13265 [Acidimicrobiales bacterium]